MNNIDNQIQLKETKKNVKLILIIVILILVLAGSTFAYFAASANNSVITGDAGTVQLSLNVTKVLPTTTGTDDILVINYSELADSVNSNCIDSDGEFALCQLYKITLTNSAAGVNTNVKGSLSFNNTTTPNLSWISLGTSYNSSTTYTSATLGSNFNTASSTFTNFVDSYLLTSGSSVNYYILVWVNETEEEQTDEGTYSGIVRFEDMNGQGVTASFAD